MIANVDVSRALLDQWCWKRSFPRSLLGPGTTWISRTRFRLGGSLLRRRHPRCPPHRERRGQPALDRWITTHVDPLYRREDILPYFLCKLWTYWTLFPAIQWYFRTKSAWLEIQGPGIDDSSFRNIRFRICHNKLKLVYKLQRWQYHERHKHECESCWHKGVLDCHSHVCVLIFREENV